MAAAAAASVITAAGVSAPVVAADVAAVVVTAAVEAAVVEAAVAGDAVVATTARPRRRSSPHSRPATRRAHTRPNQVARVEDLAGREGDLGGAP